MAHDFVIAMPVPQGLIMCDEFPATCILTELKGQISYQFIISSVQREMWRVLQWVKVNEKVLEYVDNSFYFGDLLLPQGI